MKSKGKKSPGPLGRVIFSRVIFITILHYLSLLSFSLFMRSRLFFSQRLERSGGDARVCQQHATSIQQRLALHVHTQGALHNFSLFCLSALPRLNRIGISGQLDRVPFNSTVQLCVDNEKQATRRRDGKQENNKSRLLIFSKEKNNSIKIGRKGTPVVVIKESPDPPAL
jgi:hypothetical protein